MGNFIPEKTFDAQMHIIRDARFDVDKYKVGELYVINNTLKILDNNELHDIDKTLKDFVDCEPILFQKNKVIGELIKVDERSLTFKVLVNHPDPRYIAVYSYEHFTLSIDKILEYHIEIERLLTETEAAVYLTSAFVKESANDLFNSQIDWQKEPTVVNYYRTPEKYQGDTSVYTSPKPDIQAAYKIDKDEAKELIGNGPMKIVEDMVRKRYVTNFGNDGKYEEFIVGNRISVYAFHGLADCKRVNIRLVKGKSTIDIRLSSNKLSFFEKSIHIGGGACSIDMELHVDSMRDMFDEIIFYAQQ